MVTWWAWRWKQRRTPYFCRACPTRQPAPSPSRWQMPDGILAPATRPTLLRTPGAVRTAREGCAQRVDDARTRRADAVRVEVSPARRCCSALPPTSFVAGWMGAFHSEPEHHTPATEAWSIYAERRIADGQIHLWRGSGAAVRSRRSRGVRPPGPVVARPNGFSRQVSVLGVATAAPLSRPRRPPPHSPPAWNTSPCTPTSQTRLRTRSTRRSRAISQTMIRRYLDDLRLR